MNRINLSAACALGLLLVFSANSASAGDVLAVEGQAKKGGNMVSFEYVPEGEEVAFEFEYVLPSDARNVNVSGCAKKIVKTHTAFCDYRVKEQKILVMVYSPENQPIPAAGLDLGFVSYTAAAKVSGERVTGLVAADRSGSKVASKAHVDNKITD